MTRTSIVGEMKINVIELSSVMKVGDSERLTSENWALTIERQVSTYIDIPENLNNMHPFNTPVYVPVVNESVNMTTHSDAINVIRVELKALSGSSFVHVGSINSSVAESKIRFIKQFVKA